MSSSETGGRSTAVKLSGDRIFLFASTTADAESKAKIDELTGGKGVAYIAALDEVHHLFIKEWADHSPEAKLIGVEGSPSKVPGVKWHKLFGRDADPLAELNGEIKGEHFTSFLNKDVAFLHVASKSLIQADLIFNLPAHEQYSKASKSATGGLFGGLAKYYQPLGGLHRFTHRSLITDKKKFGESAKVVAGWDFERIIGCHGDVIEGKETAQKAWSSVYGSYIKAASQ